jgi:hypothetical protein
LTKVLPARIANDELFGVGGEAEARVFRLSTDKFDRVSGSTGFLCSLLDELLRQADALGIAEVQRVRRDYRQYGNVVSCLDAFVDYLPHTVPHFILVDEVQNFFLLTKPDGTLDGPSIDQMRRCLFMRCLPSPFDNPVRSQRAARQNLQVAGRRQPRALHVGGHWEQHGNILGQSGSRPGERLFDSEPSVFGAPANTRGQRRAGARAPCASSRVFHSTGAVAADF